MGMIERTATSPTSGTSPTLAEAVNRLARRLDDAGVEEARGDARLLAVQALGIDRIALHVDRDRVLSSEELAALDRLARRRAAREPVSRIVGQREFWSLSFDLSAATLDPRPDSETLIQAALDRVPDRDRPLTILDLGTGSGCLLIALLTEFPNARGIGIDVSHEAAATARCNAVKLGVATRAAFLVGDWASSIGRCVDLVVGNPPYIADAEIAGLAPEVALFDPHAALAGGADGLNAYRALAPALPALLHPGGWVLLEVGAGQAQVVASLLADAGLADLETIYDLGGVQRCLCGKK